jgi:catechol 2,3-dioxygenase-like lactoylglutathione lyase family enzyme
MLGESLRPFLPLLTLAISYPAWAQIAAPNEAGVAFGHFHTIVRDVDATKKFWITLGGTPLKIDGTEVVKFPAVFVFLTQGFPSGGSFGSVVNHVKFLVPDVDQAVAQWKERGAIAEAVHSEYAGNLIGWAYTPDNLKVRFNPDKSLTVPIGRPGIQYWGTASAVPEIQAWYSKTFGGKIGSSANNGGSVDGIPGFQLTVTSSGEQPPARTPRGVGLINGKLPNQAFMDKLAQTSLREPTKGRTLDHLGFEIVNLEAFCKRLEAGGVMFEEPYSKSRHTGFASARFTDPWGVSIELTEGLRRF